MTIECLRSVHSIVYRKIFRRYNKHDKMCIRDRLIMQRNNITRAVYVGDTAGDEQSARVAGIPFVYCAYGFVEAVAPDYTIQSFAQLPEPMSHIVP